MTWVKKRQLVNYGGETAVKIGGDESLFFESEIKKFPNDYSVSFNEKLNSRVYEVHSNELKEVIWEKGKLVNLIEREDMIKSSFFVLIEVQEKPQKIEFQNEQGQIADNKGKEVEKNQFENKEEKQATAETNLESIENELKELKGQYELGRIDGSKFKKKLAELEKDKQKIIKQNEENSVADSGGSKVGKITAAGILGSSSLFLLLLLVAKF